MLLPFIRITFICFCKDFFQFLSTACQSRSAWWTKQTLIIKHGGRLFNAQSAWCTRKYTANKKFGIQFHTAFFGPYNDQVPDFLNREVYTDILVISKSEWLSHTVGIRNLCFYPNTYYIPDESDVYQTHTRFPDVFFNFFHSKENDSSCTVQLWTSIFFTNTKHIPSSLTCTKHIPVFSDVISHFIWVVYVFDISDILLTRFRVIYFLLQ